MKAALTLSLLSTTFLSSLVYAGETTSLTEAITDGDAYTKLRYRIELVDQAGLPENATASTLRTVLGYKTETYKGLSAVLEFENVSYIGDDAFNDTLNGKADRPVIPDPKTTELNQAYLNYTGLDNVQLFAGRRAYNLANQRLLGTVGFRQNNQSFDLVGVTAKPAKGLALNYAYIWNVNRLFGDDHPLGDFDTNTHVASFDYRGFPIGKINAYALLFDNNTLSGLSTQTFGASLAGSYTIQTDIKLNYYAEYAHQSDYADNPTDFSVDYVHVNGGISKNGLSGKIGYELLGTENGSAFVTPLATVHAFNGWADKFIQTPSRGLEDLYAGGSYKVDAEGPFKGLKLDAIYHDFSADLGGNYGSEIDLQALKKINKHFYGGLKFASYKADGYATDTQKLWFTIGANY